MKFRRDCSYKGKEVEQALGSLKNVFVINYVAREGNYKKEQAIIAF